LLHSPKKQLKGAEEHAELFWGLRTDKMHRKRNGGEEQPRRTVAVILFHK